MVRRVATKQDMALSDPKPVWIDIWREQKKRRPRREKKRTPQIDWERMRKKEIAKAYRKKTDEKLNNEENWDSISRKLPDAAKEIRGTKKRQIANPWTVGSEEEMKSLHTEISTEVIRRNDLISQTFGESDGMLFDALTASRGRLVAARKNVKKRLRQLERLWWDEIIIECENAAEKGEMSTMYKTLRKLGTRSQKHQTGTTISIDEFKAQFSNVMKDRYENDPGTLMNTIKQMPDRSKNVKFITANQRLNTPPSEKELMEALDEVRESAPGKDGVRMIYIRSVMELEGESHPPGYENV